MIDNVDGVAKLAKQISLEKTTKVESVNTSADAAAAIRLDLERGLELMGDVRNRLEQAYRELSPSK